MADKKSADAGGIALTQKARKPPSLKMLSGERETLNIEVSGDFERLKATISNLDVSNGLLMQIAALGSHGKRIDEAASNFALGFVDSMKPKDTAETLLLTQMAAIHQATMMMARRLNHVENIPQQDAAERAMNKLTRSFTAQMDTLKRYRSKGQQTVRVERVTVEPGGQAVVGNIDHGGWVIVKPDVYPMHCAPDAPRNQKELVCRAKAQRCGAGWFVECTALAAVRTPVRRILTIAMANVAAKRWQCAP